ncbi:hypothetical protein PLESTB_001030800 [Pleodorina starrii]|uniref:Pherophorin domain-containing protein n=1 Tax=Pleodorina starrii TaxID=330485 RepID=A0A9W6BQN3_9CHLO|nr:hypothetical protein PLESTB_001030800 [Pleodorina starrii]
MANLIPFAFNGTPTVSRGLSSKSNQMYCLNLRTVPCADPRNACCRQGLDKVEWWSRDVCRGAVKAVYLDGVKLDQQWAANATFKIPNLNITRASIPARGRTVCLELIATSACPTLATFCSKGARGICTYALFSDDKSCCPIGNFEAISSRRRR